MKLPIERFKKEIDLIATHAELGLKKEKTKDQKKIIFEKHVENLANLVSDKPDIKRATRFKVMNEVFNKEALGLGKFKDWRAAMLKIREAALPIRELDGKNEKNKDYTPVLPSLKKKTKTGNMTEIEEYCKDEIARVRDDIETYKSMTTQEVIDSKRKEVKQKKHFWNLKPRSFNEQVYKNKYKGMIITANKLLDHLNKVSDVAHVARLAEEKLFKGAKTTIYEIIESEKIKCEGEQGSAGWFGRGRQRKEPEKPHAHGMLVMLKRDIGKAKNMDELQSLFNDEKLGILRVRYVRIKEEGLVETPKDKGISKVKIEEEINGGLTTIDRDAQIEHAGLSDFFDEAQVVLNLRQPQESTKDMSKMPENK